MLIQNSGVGSKLEGGVDLSEILISNNKKIQNKQKIKPFFGHAYLQKKYVYVCVCVWGGRGVPTPTQN